MLAEVSAAPVSSKMAVKPSACRSLFQDEPIDREERRRFTRDLDKKLNERDAERWNFHFRSGTPLAGRWEWIHVSDKAVDVPAAYDMPHLTLRVSLARALAPKAEQPEDVPGGGAVLSSVPSSVPAKDTGSSSEDEMRIGTGEQFTDSVHRRCCTPAAAPTCTTSEQYECDPSSSSQRRGTKRKQPVMTDFFKTKKSRNMAKAPSDN